MRQTASKLLLTTLGCYLVSGCSIFEPKRLAHSASAIEQAKFASAIEEVRKSSVVTDAGRALLDAGQPGFAIDTFRKALAKGEAPGPALNGLGVAYARIGRRDLAIRYFKQAIVFDPVDTRYAMNLERTNAAMETGTNAPAMLAEASGRSLGSDSETTSPVPASTGTRRLARTEIRIVTAAPQMNDLAGPRRTPRAQALARIEFADRSSQESNARWVDIAPRKGRITHVGTPPAPKPARTVRLAAANAR